MHHAALRPLYVADALVSASPAAVSHSLVRSERMGINFPDFPHTPARFSRFVPFAIDANQH